MSSCCPSQQQNNSCHAETKSKPDWLLRVTCTLVVLLYALKLLQGEVVSLPHWLLALAAPVFEIVNTMWWGMALAVLFVGLLENIPQQWVTKALGSGGNFSGIVRATFAGVLLDLCSHGILMVGMKLYQRGVSLAQVMAFLIASPWNSLSLTLILWALIGWQWTLLFIVLSMVIGVVSGLVVSRLVDSGVLPGNSNATDDIDDSSVPGFVATLKKIQWRKGLFVTVLWQGLKGSRMVLRWVLLGVILAALIRAFVPTDIFQSLFGATAMGLLMTIVAATIIEVCSEGSTPIAAELFHRASAPGNGFAFLMAGVSTDYTEVMSLKDTTKSWAIALALPLITLPQIVLMGWLLNLAA